MLNGRSDIALALLSLLFLGACKGFERDEQLAIHTRSGFFMLEDSAGALSMARYADSTFLFDYETTLGMEPGAVESFDLREERLWLGDVPGKRVISLSLADGSSKIYNLPFAPHVVGVGEDFFMVGDSAENRIAFVKIRNGKTTEVPVNGQPRRLRYNMQRFYLQVDSSRLFIMHELAFSPLDSFDLGYRITDMQFNTVRVLNIWARNGADNYYSQLTMNGDILIHENLSTNLDQVRFSPYLESRFETEYLGQVGLADSVLQLNGAAVPEWPADAFEMDFFEGHLYYTWQDTLHVRDLNSGEEFVKIPFLHNLRRALFFSGL